MNSSNLDKVYGNCHSTLIGAVVQWWLSEEDHFILKGAPEIKETSEEFRIAASKWIRSDEAMARGQRIRCDAELLEGTRGKGLLEGEGSNHEYILEKIREYFCQKRFKNLEFAIVLFYPSKLNKPYKQNEIKEAILRMKTVIGSRSLYLVLFERDSDNRFKSTLSFYYHGKIINSFKVIEINKTNMEERVKKFSNKIQLIYSSHTEWEPIYG